MFKKQNGRFDWFKLIVLTASIAIIVTAVIIPIVNKVKASIPPKEETEAVVNTARMLLKI